MSVFGTFTINTGIAQSQHWVMRNDVATVDITIALPGMLSHEIYKAVERWLVGYKTPDDHVRARITGEYVRESDTLWIL
jgi:hypothetical protein